MNDTTDAIQKQREQLDHAAILDWLTVVLYEESNSEGDLGFAAHTYSFLIKHDFKPEAMRTVATVRDTYLRLKAAGDEDAGGKALHELRQLAPE